MSYIYKYKLKLSRCIVLCTQNTKKSTKLNLRLLIIYTNTTLTDVQLFYVQIYTRLYIIKQR